MIKRVVTLYWHDNMTNVIVQIACYQQGTSSKLSWHGHAHDPQNFSSQRFVNIAALLILPPSQPCPPSHVVPAALCCGYQHQQQKFSEITDYRRQRHRVWIIHFSILKHSINDHPRRLAFIFAAISMVDKPCNRPSASTTISTSNGFDGRSPVLVNGPSVSVSSLSSGRTSRDGSDKVLAGLRGVGLEFGFIHRGYSCSICWWMRARMSLNGI